MGNHEQRHLPEPQIAPRSMARVWWMSSSDQTQFRLHFTTWDIRHGKHFGKIASAFLPNSPTSNGAEIIDVGPLDAGLRPTGERAR